MPTQNIGAISIGLNGKIVDFQRKFATAAGTMSRLSDKAVTLGNHMQKVGRNMTMYVTAPLLALGGAGVMAFSRFDKAMTESLAIMGDVSEGMRSDMARLTKELAAQSKFGASKLAESYFFLASAGLSAKQSMEALPTVLNFATAGVFDMAQATELLMDAQKALALDSANTATNLKNMTRVSDVLVKANTLANATVQQFAEALTNRAASAMRLANIEIEEGVAVLAAFADQGRKGAEAGTQMDMVLRELQRTALKQKEVFDVLGVSVFDSAGAMRKMADIIQDMEGLMGDMSVAQRRATLMTMGFQMRSVSALQALVGFSGKIREYEAELLKAGGTTKEVADKQMKAFSNQMLALKNRAGMMAGDIGRLLIPRILELARVVDRLISYWKGLSEGQKNARVTFLLWVAAIGPGVKAIGLLTNALFGHLLPALMKVVAYTIAHPGLGLTVAAAAGTAAIVKLIEETYKLIEARKKLRESEAGVAWQAQNVRAQFGMSEEQVRAANRTRWGRERQAAANLKEMQRISAWQTRVTEKATAAATGMTPLQRAQQQLSQKKQELAALTPPVREERMKSFADAIMRGGAGSLAASMRTAGQGKVIEKVEENTSESADALKEQIKLLQGLIGILSGQDVRVVSIGD